MLSGASPHHSEMSAAQNWNSFGKSPQIVFAFEHKKLYRLLGFLAADLGTWSLTILIMCVLSERVSIVSVESWDFFAT